jgi:hypothetical protein
MNTITVDMDKLAAEIVEALDAYEKASCAWHADPSPETDAAQYAAFSRWDDLAKLFKMLMARESGFGGSFFASTLATHLRGGK